MDDVDKNSIILDGKRSDWSSYLSHKSITSGYTTVAEKWGKARTTGTNLYFLKALALFLVAEKLHHVKDCIFKDTLHESILYTTNVVE